MSDLLGKAQVAVKLAKQTLPGQSEDNIRNQAMDYLAMSPLSLHKSLSRVAALKKASTPSPEAEALAAKISGLLEIEDGHGLASLGTNVLEAIESSLTASSKSASVPETMFVKLADKILTVNKTADGVFLPVEQEEPFEIHLTDPSADPEMDDIEPENILGIGQTVLTADNRVGEISEIQTIESEAGAKRIFQIAFDDGQALFGVSEEEITPVIIEVQDAAEPEQEEPAEAPAEPQEEIVEETPEEEPVEEEKPAEEPEEDAPADDEPEEEDGEKKTTSEEETPEAPVEAPVVEASEEEIVATEVPEEEIIVASEPDPDAEDAIIAEELDDVEITAADEAEFAASYFVAGEQPLTENGQSEMQKKASESLKLHKVMSSTEISEVDSIFGGLDPDISSMI